MNQTFWKRCSTCKREMGFAQSYWICSVSTCNRRGSAFVFCSLPCWQAHVPTMRHREAWAEEQRSPTREAWAGAVEAGEAGSRESTEPGGERPASASGDAGERAAAHAPKQDVPKDVLIVASKLKKYVRARAGMNTSDAVVGVLSDRVRRLCDDAIARALEDGRKTLLDRDF